MCNRHIIDEDEETVIRTDRYIFTIPTPEHCHWLAYNQPLPKVCNHKPANSAK